VSTRLALSAVALSATEVSVLCELAEEHEMSPTKNPSEFTVQELKEKLRAFGLNATGPKSDKSIDRGGSDRRLALRVE